MTKTHLPINDSQPSSNASAQLKDKIEKLLRLQQSSNEHEAAAAAAAAAALLDRHNLTMEELSEIPDIEERLVEVANGGVRTWKANLYSVLASYYQCEVVYSHYKEQGSARFGGYAIRFIGRQSNTISASIMYRHIAEAIEELLKRELARHKEIGLRVDRTFHGGFREGCVVRVYQRLLEMSQEREQNGVTDEEGNISAIVLASMHDRMIQENLDYMKEKYPDIPMARKRLIRPREGYLTGLDRGDEIGLSAQVGAAENASEVSGPKEVKQLAPARSDV